MTTTRRWLDDEAGWHPVERLGVEPVRLKGWNLKMMDESAGMTGVKALDAHEWVREEEQRTMRAKLRARKLAAYDRKVEDQVFDVDPQRAARAIDWLACKEGK